jgi:MoxR-like ATPase
MEDVLIGAPKLALEKFSEVIIGQKRLGERLMMALVAEGHILLEGLPGLAKTTAIKTMAALTGLQFHRIQFTPDLLPADVIGTQVYEPRSATFQVRKGPIFTNLLLADEINRAPAKVQSALLEAMQERQVTIGGETFFISRPFLVLATQNPIEQEGTYPLPEAQLDRFMFKLKVGYGSAEDELLMLQRYGIEHDTAQTSLFTRDVMIGLREKMASVRVAEALQRYIVDLVVATREPSRYRLDSIKNLIDVGASPRATLWLERAARLNAVFRGRDYVMPQDVKDIAVDVLRHRLILSVEADVQRVTVESIIEKVLSTVPLPK